MATTERSQIQNPYSAENRAEYKMGAIEEWLHNMGFRTGIDNYNMEMDNRAREWDTQNQSLSYEENYNSPEEQAARMRAAGMNPDITGDMNPGQAAEMAESQIPLPAAETDIENFQKIGAFAANIGGTLIDIFTQGTAGWATIKNMKLAVDKFKSERELKEDESIRQSALDAIYDYGSDEEYENGAYVGGKIKGFTGKRLEKFANMYDELYASYPRYIASQEQEKNAKNSAFENEITDGINNIKRIMAEAQTKAAEIINEKNKREIEFLQKHPEYNEAETEALIKQGNKEAVEYRNISLNAQAKLDDLNSSIIKEYEEAQAQDRGHYERDMQGNQIWIPQTEEERKRDYWRYRRARKRIGAKGTSISAGGFGISD